jgi:hypothetical protein
MINGSRKNVKKQNEMVAEKDLPPGVSRFWAHRCLGELASESRFLSKDFHPMSNHRTTKPSLDACTQPKLINAITSASGRNVRSVEKSRACSKHLRIKHAVGKVVVGVREDFYDDRSLNKKARPVVVLAPGGCKHAVAPPIHRRLCSSLREVTSGQRNNIFSANSNRPRR